MMIRPKQLKIAFSLALTAGFFQNCAPANFKPVAAAQSPSQSPSGSIVDNGGMSDTSNMVLTTNVPLTNTTSGSGDGSGTASGSIVANGGSSGTSGTSGTSGSSGSSGSSGGSVTANGGMSGTSGGTSGTNGGTTSGTSNTSNTSNTSGLPSGSKQIETQDEVYDTNIPSQVVECEIHSPSIKVILSDGFTSSHSNASATRVCMSSHACLDMINAYASDRGCTLDAGAPTSPNSNQQCTRIFPGSRGTCHNAKLVSDSFIHDMLVKMSQK